MKNQLNSSTLARDPATLYSGLIVTTEMTRTPRMKTVMIFDSEKPKRVKISPIPVAAIRSSKVKSASFSVGRIKEAKEDYEGAAAAYEAIASYELSNDDWNDLAKTRLLDLKNKGLVK